MSTQHTPGLPAVAYVEAIRVAVGELRGSWPWLADMAVPGPSTPHGERYQSPEQVAIEASQVRKDRRARIDAIRAGTTMAPHADAGRVGPISARPVVAAMVRRITARLWVALHPGQSLVWPILDPTGRATMRGCWFCEGRGRAIGRPTPENPAPPGSNLAIVTCPDCGGRGEVPTGVACVACSEVGPCGCDYDDAYVLVGLAIISSQLATLGDADLASQVLHALEVADRTVRRAVGADSQPIALKAPCPACQRRDLVVDCASPNEAEWAIRCASRLCQCSGPPCGCGRPVRYKGRRHLWPEAEWHGKGGLAGRLGVDLAALARGQHADAARRGARIRSGRDGHGGWRQEGTMWWLVLGVYDDYAMWLAAQHDAVPRSRTVRLWDARDCHRILGMDGPFTVVTLPTFAASRDRDRVLEAVKSRTVRADAYTGPTLWLRWQDGRYWEMGDQ